MDEPTMNARTALYTGYLIGHLLKAGLKVYPVLDESGNYTEDFEVEVPAMEPGLYTEKIRVRCLA